MKINLYFTNFTRNLKWNKQCENARVKFYDARLKDYELQMIVYLSGSQTLWRFTDVSLKGNKII